MLTVALVLIESLPSMCNLVESFVRAYLQHGEHAAVIFEAGAPTVRYQVYLSCAYTDCSGLAEPAK